MIRPISIAELFSAPASAKLFTEYAQECSIPFLGEISPQSEIYAALEKNGVLRCLGVFDGEALIGFATVLITPNPHYGKRIAVVESLFLLKARRNSSRGRKLMKVIESFAKEQGCAAVGYSAPTSSQLERLFTLLPAYTHTNTVFMRPL